VRLWLPARTLPLRVPGGAGRVRPGPVRDVAQVAPSWPPCPTPRRQRGLSVYGPLSYPASSRRRGVASRPGAFRPARPSGRRRAGPAELLGPRRVLSPGRLACGVVFPVIAQWLGPPSAMADISVWARGSVAASGAGALRIEHPHRPVAVGHAERVRRAERSGRRSQPALTQWCPGATGRLIARVRPAQCGGRRRGRREPVPRYVGGLGRMV